MKTMKTQKREIVQGYIRFAQVKTDKNGLKKLVRAGGFIPSKRGLIWAVVQDGEVKEAFWSRKEAEECIP